MSKPSSKPLVTVGTEGTDPPTGTSTELWRIANRQRTRQETKASGGQLPYLVTNAPETGYQPTPQEQAVAIPIIPVSPASCPGRGSKSCMLSSTLGRPSRRQYRQPPARGVVGTNSLDFLDTLLSQRATVGSPRRKPDERGLNFLFAVAQGIEPRDQVEAMLAARMAAVHVAKMTLAQRLACVEIIPQQDSTERAFNIRQSDSGEPMSPADLTAATGMKPLNVRQLLLKMIRVGEVVKQGRSQYPHSNVAGPGGVTPGNNDNILYLSSKEEDDE